MYGQLEIQLSPQDLVSGLGREIFYYALDLLNFGHYWESHVYLECLWNAFSRKGDSANLCKALIKIAAAGVKFKTQQLPSAHGHLQRASEILSLLPETVFDYNSRELKIRLPQIDSLKTLEKFDFALLIS